MTCKYSEKMFCSSQKHTYPCIPKFNFASVTIFLASINRISSSRHNIDSTEDGCGADRCDDDDEALTMIVAVLLFGSNWCYPLI